MNDVCLCRWPRDQRSPEWCLREHFVPARDYGALSYNITHRAHTLSPGHRILHYLIWFCVSCGIWRIWKQTRGRNWYPVPPFSASLGSFNKTLLIWQGLPHVSVRFSDLAPFLCYCPFSLRLRRYTRWLWGSHRIQNRQSYIHHAGLHPLRPEQCVVTSPRPGIMLSWVKLKTFYSKVTIFVVVVVVSHTRGS